MNARKSRKGDRRRGVRGAVYLFIIILFILFLTVPGLSPIVAIGSHSPVAVHGLLIAVASLVEDHGLQSSCSSQALEHRLSSCVRAYLLHGM